MTKHPADVVPPPAATGLRTLFTHHDTNHMHKTLGALVLVSYVYRMVNMGAQDMRFDGGNQTLLTIVLHAALSLSSLIFRIPARRISEGTRIWPQFRLHSIIFTCRALAVLTLLWAARRWPRFQAWMDNSHGAANIAVTFAAMLAADAATAAVGKHGSDSIRGWNTSPARRFFFAVMQFQGTAVIMVGLPRFQTYFFHVLILQLTAFLLTLRRKNIVGHAAVSWVYGILLVLGAAVSLYDFVVTERGDMVGSIGLAAYLLRVGVGVNKYAVWALFAALTVACSVYVDSHGGPHSPDTAWLAGAWKAVQLPLYGLLFFWAWPKYKTYCASKAGGATTAAKEA